MPFAIFNWELKRILFNCRGAGYCCLISSLWPHGWPLVQQAALIGLLASSRWCDHNLHWFRQCPQLWTSPHKQGRWPRELSFGGLLGICLSSWGKYLSLLCSCSSCDTSAFGLLEPGAEPAGHLRPFSSLPPPGNPRLWPRSDKGQAPAPVAADSGKSPSLRAGQREVGRPWLCGCTCLAFSLCTAEVGTEKC